MPDRGIVYVAVGSHYLAMAKFSVRTLRAAGCDAPVTIFTQRISMSRHDIEILQQLEVSLVELKCCSFSRSDHALSRRAKIISLLESPYRLALYFDTDIAFRQSPDELFATIEKFGFVISTNAKLMYEDAEGSRPTCQKLVALTDGMSLNTGVVGIKRSAATLRLIEQWKCNLERRQDDETIGSSWKRASDQEALQEIFVSGGMVGNCFILPNTIWNSQDVIWCEMSRQNRWSDIKILHSRLCFERQCIDEILAGETYCRQFILGASKL